MADSKKSDAGTGYGAAGSTLVGLVGAYIGGQQVLSANNALRKSENVRAGTRLRGAVYDKWLSNNARSRAGQAQMAALLESSINEQKNYAAGRFEAGLQAASQLGAARAASGAAGGFSSAAQQVQAASMLRAARLDQRIDQQSKVAQTATTARAKALADQTFRGYDGRVLNVNVDNRDDKMNPLAALLNGLSAMGKTTSADGVQSVLRGLFAEKPADPYADNGGSTSYEDAAANADSTDLSI